MNTRAWLEMRMQLRNGASNRTSGVARANHGAAGFVNEIVGDQQARGSGSGG